MSGLLAGDLAVVEAAPGPGDWFAVGDVPSPRQWASPAEGPVLLTDGTVLAAGGSLEAGASTDEVLLFDPTTSGWSSTAKLGTARRSHSLTLLADGRVLVAGGLTGPMGPPFVGLATAEIYDPATKAWTPAGEMATGRSLHAATLLADGRVLVTGGEGDRSPKATRRTLHSAELFDPTTGAWTLAEPMTDARLAHPAVLLRDGRVLAIGGNLGIGGEASIGQGFCELYDPVAGIWSPTGSLRSPRRNHQAAVLADGTVLVTGGDRPDIRLERLIRPYSLWTTERYDPATETWTPAENMPSGRSYHRSVRLADGSVLVIGGTDSATYAVGYQNAVAYQPRTRRWTPTPGMLTGRYYAGAVALGNDRVLVAGGTVRSGMAGTDLLTATTEIFSLTGEPPIPPPTDAELDAWAREAVEWSRKAAEHFEKKEYPQAADCQQKALDLFTKVRRWRPVYAASWAQCSLFLAVYQQAAGRHEAAVKSCRDAVAAYESIDDKPRTAWAYGNLGTICSRAGRAAEAVTAQQRSREIYQQLTAGDPAYRKLWAHTSVFLGAYLSAVSRHDEAIAMGNEAVELYRQADDQSQVAWAYTNLAARYRSASRATDAANAQRSARDIYRTVSQSDPAYRGLLAQTSVTLAGLLVPVSLYDEAVAAGREAVDLYRQIDDQPQLAWALANHRSVLRFAGRHDESLAAGQEARDIYYRLAQTEPGFRAPLAQTAHDLAYVLETVGRRQDAIASAREAVTLYEPLAQADPGRYAAFLAASRDLLARLEGAG